MPICKGCGGPAFVTVTLSEFIESTSPCGCRNPKCPECGETLYSHAGRFWKLFHLHVIDGPYPNPQPHPLRCSLVNQDFNADGSIVVYEELARELEEYAKRSASRNG
jgi:hypothetical protein